MRIQIIRKLTPLHIDTRLDRFQLGCRYEVGTTIGRLFIAGGWASLVGEEEPALRVPPVAMEYGGGEHSTTQHHGERNVPSLKDAIAADTALDDAIAKAIERVAMTPWPPD